MLFSVFSELMIVFMKRDLFILMGLGLLMSATIVSCEDKVIDKDNGSESRKEGSEVVYRTVQDSAFSYRDGKLSQASRYYYDSDGKIIRELIHAYDTDGNLTRNEEGIYTYRSYSYDVESDYTVVYDNNGLTYDRKIEQYSKHSGNNITSTRKSYSLIDGKWLIWNEQCRESNDNKGISKGITYGYLDGKRIIVSSSFSESFKNPLESTSTSVNYNYSKNYTVDRDDPYYYASGPNYYIPIKSLNGESWQRITSVYAEDGQLLERVTLESNDSIEWNETSRIEHKYDSNGNLLEEKQTGIVNNYRYSYTYDNNGNLIKEERFRKAGNDEDLILYQSGDFSYSAAGKLMTVDVYGTANVVSLPLTLSVDESGKVLGVEGVMSMSVAGTVDNTIGVRCSVICNANGNPLEETLYVKDDYGNWEESGRCSFEHDSNGNILNYVVRKLEDGEWIETASMRSTYDSNGNLLSQNIKTVRKGSYSNIFYSYTFTLESESVSKREYDTLGYISYQFSSSVSREHVEYSDDRVDDRILDSSQEIFSSTIKVK